MALSWAAAPDLVADQYHTVATNASGSILVATTISNGAAGSQLYLSTDSGANFAPSTAPAGSWISVDMTPAGERMIAAQFGGGLYRSVDSGATWAAVDTVVNPTGSLAYEGVTVSEGGTRAVAVVMNGSIFHSSNFDAAAPTFAVATLVGGGALTDSFRSVDSSANGMTVVAASHNGDIYISGDGGATFETLDVIVGGAEVNDGWYRVAISDDGTRIAVAGNSDFGTGVPAATRSTGLYVGNLAGGTWTWTQASTASGAYTSIAMPGSGGVIAASMSSVSGGGGGQVLLSSNGGQTFAPITTPTGEANWRAIALTDDASRAILAAGTFLATNGQVYLSSGSLTGQ